MQNPYLICKHPVCNDVFNDVFKKDYPYTHSDDRGEDDAACIYSPEVKQKIYFSKKEYEKYFEEVTYDKYMFVRCTLLIEEIALKLNAHNPKTGHTRGLELGMLEEMNKITDLLVEIKL